MLNTYIRLLLFVTAVVSCVAAQSGKEIATKVKAAAGTTWTTWGAAVDAELTQRGMAAGHAETLRQRSDALIELGKTFLEDALKDKKQAERAAAVRQFFTTAAIPVEMQVAIENQLVNNGISLGTDSEEHFPGAAKKFPFELGLGFAVMADIGDTKRAKSARLADGLVVIDDEEDVTPRFVLESHYWIRDNIIDPIRGIPPSNRGRFDFGPMVMLVPGGDTIVDSAGVGIMLGFKRKEKEGDIRPTAFNLGVAYTIDFNVQTLADGFKEGQAPPGGATQVTLKETHQSGISAVFSISW